MRHRRGTAHAAAVLLILLLGQTLSAAAELAASGIRPQLSTSASSASSRRLLRQSLRQELRRSAQAPLSLDKLELVSQLGQDRWVLEHMPALEVSGTYLEIGAHKGKYLSNTFILDKLGWKGTCVEPFPSDFEEQNRTCKVVREVVSGASGQEVSFVKPSETSLGGIEATLSGAEQIPRPNETIIVNMTTLGIRDLLQQHNVPRHFTYFSLDAEGQEYTILKHFPWCGYSFGMLTVEHNRVEPQRSYVRELLESHGYVFAQEKDVDDWYIAGNATDGLAASMAAVLAGSNGASGMGQGATARQRVTDAAASLASAVIAVAAVLCCIVAARARRRRISLQGKLSNGRVSAKRASGPSDN